MPQLVPHPDRLLPAGPGTREIARRLYAEVSGLPIISPHGHVPPEWLAQDIPFADPTTLLISPDHYVTRLLHSAGVDLAGLGVGGHPLDDAGKRAAWRTFCAHWPVYRGTAIRFWMESELHDIFGVTERPSAESADAIYDRIAAALATPEYRPRALFERFGIAILATTDDPCDDLHHHAALAADETFAGRVLPTFRPDRYLEPGRDGWSDLVDALGAATGVDTGTYAGFRAALAARRQYFKDHGAVSTDHSHADVVTLILDDAEAHRLFARCRSGEASAQEATTLRRFLLVEMARMAVDDGLVMTLHPAVYRNHSTASYERFGADTGCDIPLAVEWTTGLQPLLAEVGLAPGFQVVLFTLDKDTFSREVAPLAGFYPSVYAGAPWWFLDAPEAIRGFQGAVSDIAGFSRMSGFIDDTRAFCSIPARHDLSRRLDCAFLAELVATHRLEEDEAAETARALVADNPRKAFKL